MIAEKVIGSRQPCGEAHGQTRAEQTQTLPVEEEKKEEKKEGVVARRKTESLACKSSARGQDAVLMLDNATNFTTGRASGAVTSTAWAPQVRNERELLDEEECECDEADSDESS